MISTIQRFLRVDLRADILALYVLMVAVLCSICLSLFLCPLHGILSRSDSRLLYRVRRANETHILSQFTHICPKCSPPWCAARTMRWSTNYDPGVHTGMIQRERYVLTISTYITPGTGAPHPRGLCRGNPRMLPLMLLER